MANERIKVQRRQFLKTTVIVAGGVGLFGCSDGGKGGGGGSFGGRDVVDGSKYFPQSVASGDPREASVILWARVEDPKGAGKDLPLMLEVALDKEFDERIELADDGMLSAKAAHDGCVRARVEGLEANTVYYYRFAYLVDDTAYVSRTARTKTAPAADADVPVKFGVANCQDYVGRYYHSYKHMAGQDLDFFLHLGDYVYETTGNPEFQVKSGKRVVKFEDTKNAMPLGEGKDTFYAANALSNYRDLYKTYRSDPDLQRVHELFPMIAVWDDHEFSDDCHGQTATYFDGAKDELEPARRSHADQAWFEYMPVDYTEPDFEYDPKKATSFPADITIYRDFTFGKHVHVVMTDLRRYRDDHLVPEDAFPGAVAATQEELMTALSSVPDFAVAYVDLDDAAYAEQKAALNVDAETLGFVEGDFAGLVGVDFVNAQLDKLTTTPKPAHIDATGQKRGVTFDSMFKSRRFSSLGSRYVVISEPYDAYARVLWSKSKGKAQQILGDKQEKWFFDTIRGSKQTWKLWGNEFTFQHRAVDLRKQPLAAAVGLQKLLNLSAEDWDGVPDRRAKILDELGDVPNLVALTGDIHAFFAGLARSADKKKAIVEFVAGAISSGTYRDLLAQTAMSISPVAVALAENANFLLAAGNTHIGHVNAEKNGYAVVSASAEALNVSFYEIESAAILSATAPAKLDSAFEVLEFLVQAGKKQLFREQNGKMERLDPDTGKWVAG